MSLNVLIVMGARPLGDFGLALLVSAFSVASVAVGGAVVVGGYTAFLASRRGLGHEPERGAETAVSPLRGGVVCAEGSSPMVA